MAEITSNESFDTELLDQEIAEQIEPLTDWLMENMSIILDALRGGLGDKNSSTQYVQVKAQSGVRESFSVQGPVSNVTVSRVVSQPDSGIYYTGFNWWKTQDGFDYLVTYNGTKTDRDVVLKVEFNL